MALGRVVGLVGAESAESSPKDKGGGERGSGGTCWPHSVCSSCPISWCCCGTRLSCSLSCPRGEDVRLSPSPCQTPVHLCTSSRAQPTRFTSSAQHGPLKQPPAILHSGSGSREPPHVTQPCRSPRTVTRRPGGTCDDSETQTDSQVQATLLQDFALSRWRGDLGRKGQRKAASLEGRARRCSPSSALFPKGRHPVRLLTQCWH